MNNMYETAGGIGELGNPLNESFCEERYSFDENQADLLRDVLPSEGIQTVEDLEKADIQELVDAVDKKVKYLKPDLPTKVNMSRFGEESDVWKEFKRRLEPKYLEAPSDKIQKEQIASAMFEMEELRFENWKNLSLESKLEVLNTLEKKIAAIEHRQAAVVRSEPMESDLNGFQNENGVTLNEKRLLRTNESPEILLGVLKTFIHEGRHMYQDYNIHVRQVHESSAAVDSWRENLEKFGYADGEPIYLHPLGFNYTNEGLSSLGARLYYYQPVEIDARVFAEDVIKEYKKKINA